MSERAPLFSAFRQGEGSHWAWVAVSWLFLLLAFFMLRGVPPPLPILFLIWLFSMCSFMARLIYAWVQSDLSFVEWIGLTTLTLAQGVVFLLLAGATRAYYLLPMAGVMPSIALSLFRLWTTRNERLEEEAYRQRQYERARERARDHPQASASYFLLAEAAARLGRLQEAIEAAERSLGLDPSNSQARENQRNP